jgi:hypothetical protein
MHGAIRLLPLPELTAIRAYRATTPIASAFRSKARESKIFRPRAVKRMSLEVLVSLH